jgi:hypothetical protein
MRKIIALLLLLSVFAVPSFAEAGNKHLLKKMTKPTCKDKMAKLKECLHPCK